MRPRLLSLALLAACKRDPGGNGAYGALPDAHVKFTADGDGPTNELTLQPLAAGTRASNGWNWDRWPGTVDAGRDDVLLHDASGGNSLWAPTFGSGVGLYRGTRDGLVVHALDAPLDDEVWPVLMVPETVRVGMTWESEYRDGGVNRMTVSAHQSVMLPTGPAEAWAIGEFIDEATVGVTRWYAEGIGRIVLSDDGTDGPPVFGPTDLVVVQQDQEHVEPGLEPVPLTGVLPLVQHITPHDLFGVSGSVSDGELWVLLDGLDEAFAYTPDMPHDECAQLDDTPQFVLPGRNPACPTTTISVHVPYGEGYVSETILVDNVAKELPGTTTVLDLTGAGTVLHDTLTGWVVDGVVHTLSYDETSPTNPQFNELTWPTETPTRAPIVDAIPARNLHVPAPYQNSEWNARNSLVGQLWLGPARVDAGADLHFAVIVADGRVFAVTLAEGTLTGFAPVGVLPGAVSVFLNGDERSAYSITTDGRVFELRVDQATGDVAINGLGAVRVEEPGGRYVFKGVVPDPTHPGDIYVAAEAYVTDDAPVYTAGLFFAHLDREPIAIVTAPSLNVGMATTDAGLAVCWPPTDEPFDGAGWTLRGQPVEAFGDAGPGGQCAVFAYDRTLPADPRWAGAERALAGSLPGIGPVRLGFPAARHVGLPLSTTVSVLRDGSIVDHLGERLDHAGFPTSHAYMFTQPGPQDLAGYGQWVYDGGLVLRNIGGGLVTPPCPVGPTEICLFGGPVQGGGLLYQNRTAPTGVQVVRPDGTVEDLPAAQVGAMATGILLTNGRLCGVADNRKEIDCVAPDGTMTSTGPLYEGFLSASDRDEWWPLPDGALLFTNYEGPAWRFDPDTLGYAVLDERVLRGKSTSTDGHVYAVASTLDGTSTLVEVTSTGVTDLAPVATGAVAVPIDGGFLVSDGATPAGWKRVPR